MNVQLYTNIKLLEWTGHLHTGTWTSIILSAFVICIDILQIIHYFVKIKDYEEVGLAVAVEHGHYVVTFSVLMTGTLSVVGNSKKFLEMDRLLRSGFFSHDPDSEIDDKHVTAASKRLLRVDQVIVGWYTMALTTLYSQWLAVASPVPRGWTPLWVENALGHDSIAAFQMVGIFVGTVSGGSVGLSFVGITLHLCAQMKRLGGTIRRLRTHNPGADFSRRAKNIVRHHILIKKVFKEFQDIYNLYLFLSSVSMGVMLCATGFLIMQDKRYSDTIEQQSNLDKFRLSSLFVSELCLIISYCYFGEQVTKEADNLSKEVYFVDWENHPKEIKKIWLMMLCCNKGFTFTGYRLQEYNLKGLAEILQATYSYFNVLLAMR